MDLLTLQHIVQFLIAVGASLGSAVWVNSKQHMRMIDHQNETEYMTYSIQAIWDNAPPMRSNDPDGWMQNKAGDGSDARRWGSQEE